MNTLARAISPDERKRAATVYAQLMEQARNPWLYEVGGVPDTLDGRFELLVMHLFLFLRRVREDERYEGEYGEFIESVMELLFDDMDQMLREEGVGDMGVGKRVRAMSEAVYGRFNAYEEALHLGVSAVREALLRNVYGTVDPEELEEEDVEMLQGYLGQFRRYLDRYPVTNLLNGMLQPADPRQLIEDK